MKWLSNLSVALALCMSAGASRAADGCTVLLCLAGPWMSIQQCVPPVAQTLRDLALGKPFPVCDMSGEGNGARNDWATEATCPEMYRNYNQDNGVYEACAYPGRITVVIDGQLWSEMFWTTSGPTSTRYSDYARAQLGDSLDPTYDRDLAAWEAAHQPPPECDTCEVGG
jgi:hypothetical protein